MEQYLFTGLISAAGAYGAVWAHLKFIAWRLDRNEETARDHHDRISYLEKRLESRV